MSTCDVSDDVNKRSQLGACAPAMDTDGAEEKAGTRTPKNDAEEAEEKSETRTPKNDDEGTDEKSGSRSSKNDADAAEVKSGSRSSKSSSESQPPKSPPNAAGSARGTPPPGSGRATPTPSSARATPTPSQAALRRTGSVTPGRVTSGATHASDVSVPHDEVEPPPPPPPPKVEPNVIADASLSLLSGHIVQKRVLLAMYLNVPTADLVTVDTHVREQQLAHKQPPTLDQLRQQLERQIARSEPFEPRPSQPLSPERMEIEVAYRLLKHWRSLKGNAKDKDKVAELVRALRMIERTDLGDVIVTQNISNLELTVDLLPIIKSPSIAGPVAKARKSKSRTPGSVKKLHESIDR